jgi:hypothetical protein
MKRSVGPVAVGTTGTGTTGKIVDRKGFKDVEFIFGYGAITATNATVTVIVEGRRCHRHDDVDRRCRPRRHRGERWHRRRHAAHQRLEQAGDEASRLSRPQALRAAHHEVDNHGHDAGLRRRAAQPPGNLARSLPKMLTLSS